MFLPVLIKPVFFGLLVAYLVGENALIILPLVSAVFIGLSFARNSRFRVLLLICSLIVGSMLGVLANSWVLSVYVAILLGLTLLASVMSGITLGLMLRHYSWGKCLFTATSIIFIALVM
ncbi:MAG: hypothetical protein N3G21_10185, partial [Candidatus Hydrogenedentes bacterium]|nr:hypothetical protein [Candidatus Hydrogenedentota bacterium]